MTTSKLFTARNAALVLGIGYPTLKQLIHKKKIRTLRTTGGHYITVDGLVVQVTISHGGQQITSIMNADAVREMRLKNGQTVIANVVIIRL